MHTSSKGQPTASMGGQHFSFMMMASSKAGIAALPPYT
jgi:hypothetical protein